MDKKKRLFSSAVEYEMTIGTPFKDANGKTIGQVVACDRYPEHRLVATIQIEDEKYSQYVIDLMREAQGEISMGCKVKEPELYRFDPSKIPCPVCGASGSAHIHSMNENYVFGVDWGFKPSETKTICAHKFPHEGCNG